MIHALDEDIAFAMCGGCPVPDEVQMSYCHKWRGDRGMEQGNLCLLREIQRNQPSYMGPSVRVNKPRSVPSRKTRDRHHERKEPVTVVAKVRVRTVLIRPSVEDTYGIIAVSVMPKMTYRSQPRVNMTDDMARATVVFTGPLRCWKRFLQFLVPDKKEYEDGEA